MDKFSKGDRVAVIAEEPDQWIRETYGAIPVGTTGMVLRYSGSDKNPKTGEDEPFISVVFDLPYMGNKNHRNMLGQIEFDVFESMIELVDEGLPAIDMDELFERCY